MVPSVRSGGLAALALAALLAPLSGQRPAARDSAGVRIVTFTPRPDAPFTVAVGAKPSLDLGGLQDDPALEFTANQGYLRAAPLSNGGLAVIDVSRVQYFDGAGKRTAIAGRLGAGPNEFRYLTSVCATRGDTLAVFDGHNRRITILDGKGGIVRSFPQGDLGFLPFDGCFPDGTLLFTKSLTQPGAPGERVEGLRRVRLDGTVAHEFPPQRLAPFNMIAYTETAHQPGAVGLTVGLPDDGRILQYDPTGRLIRILRSGLPAIRITEEMAEERMKATIPRDTPESEVRARLDRMRSQPRPDAWPAFGRVLLDPKGRLWIQDHPATMGTPAHWTLVDVDGQVLGRLETPPYVRGKMTPQVIAFGVDRVLLRTADDDGAAHIGWWPLVKRSGAR